MHKDYLKNFHAHFFQDLFNRLKQNKATYSIKTFQKDQSIGCSGDPCRMIGIVLSGQVKIEQLLTNGTKVRINTLKQYDIFGEILIFSQDTSYPYDIIALNNCEILFINKINLLKIFKEDSDLLEKFLYHISISYINLNKLIKLKSQKDILHKIAYYLIHYGDITEDQFVCHIQSKTQLAELFGVERQSLIRVLNELVENKYLTYDRKHLYIKDFHYFKQLVE